MHSIPAIIQKFSRKERWIFFVSLVLFVFFSLGWLVITIVDHSTNVPFFGGTWREGIVGQPTTPNPILANTEADESIVRLVFSSLGELTETIQKDEETNSYIVTLKQGLVWSDKKPLTSDDVVFTVQSIQDPAKNSPQAKNWYGVLVERISELQIRFTLPTSYTFFEENLKNLRPIPKHIFQNTELGEKKKQNILEPIGSGPYQIKIIKKRRDGFVTRYDFFPNETHVHHKPYIKNFSLVFFSTQEEVEQAFRMNRIDAFGTALPYVHQWLFGKEEQIPLSRLYAVFFNPNKNLALKDPNVRYALNRATPKKQIQNEVFQGRAQIISSPVLFSKNNSETENSFAPDLARELLEKTGKKKITITLTVPNTPFLVQTAERIKKGWEDAGVESVQLQIQDPKDIFQSTIQNGSYEAILFGNILENPKDLFSFWHSSQKKYPGLNLSLFSDPIADELLEKIRTTTNAETREAELTSLEGIITRETPAIFLFSLPYTYIHNTQLHGAPLLENKTPITTPADRFFRVEEWYLSHARVVQ